MKLTLTMELAQADYKPPNEIFGDGTLHEEAARILRSAAEQIEGMAWSHALRDSNGKLVGVVRVTF